MQRERLHGVWVAMPTPLNANSTIDSGLVHELVSRYTSAGLHGAYTTGTDGEMHVLDFPDFQTLCVAVGRGSADAGIPFQVGCTWSHTDGVIERARIAADNGISRIQVALPSWVTLSDAELLEFFAELYRELPGVEFVHYNIARSGRFLNGDDYRAILDVAPNLIGSKHTGGDVSSLIDIVQKTPELDHFVVDGQIVPGALFGARGFYSFVANLAPHIALDLWEHCQKGQWEDAARLRMRIDRLFRQWREICPHITASPALGKIATKAGVLPDMSLMVRHPYQSGQDSDVQALRDLLSVSYPEMLNTI